MSERFAAFTSEEREVLRDALSTEAELDPREDPAFSRIVEVASALIDEIDAGEGH